jgi:hypothetical protein
MNQNSFLKNPLINPFDMETDILKSITYLNSNQIVAQNWDSEKLMR